MVVGFQHPVHHDDSGWMVNQSKSGDDDGGEDSSLDVIPGRGG